jgi:S1-C subfamily serine protease
VFRAPRSAPAGSVEVPEIVPSEQMIENAPVAGATLAAIRSERMGRYFGVSSGVLVTSVFGDPASSSGLEEGDVILRADGRAVRTVPQLRRLIEAHLGERSIELSVVRHEKPMTIKLRW